MSFPVRKTVGSIQVVGITDWTDTLQVAMRCWVATTLIRDQLMDMTQVHLVVNAPWGTSVVTGSPGQHLIWGKEVKAAGIILSYLPTAAGEAKRKLLADWRARFVDDGKSNPLMQAAFPKSAKIIADLQDSASYVLWQHNRTVSQMVRLSKDGPARALK